MEITWYGNASILIKGKKSSPILFDPFLGLAGASHRPDPDLLRGLSNNVFLTHGHLDHMGSIRKLYGYKKRRGEDKDKMKIYCTKTPAKALMRQGLKKKILRVISPGEKVNLQRISVTALKGKHVEFDLGIVFHSALRFEVFRYCYNLPKLGYMAVTEQEQGETMVYSVQTDGQTALLLGSLNLNETALYPAGVDILILPCQGRSDLNASIDPILGKLNPKAVLLDHFDNAFPPVSSEIDVKPVIDMINEKYPGIKVIVPEFGKTIRIEQEGAAPASRKGRSY